MLNCKKILSVAMVLLLSLPMTVSAAESKGSLNSDTAKVQQQAKMLFEEAKVNGEKGSQKIRLTNQNGVAYDLNVYSIDTTKITTYAASQGLESVTFVASTDDMKLVSDAKPDGITPLGVLEDDYWDNTGSVCFTSTLYYDRNDNADGDSSYLLEEVAGALDFNSSGVSVNLQKVTYGCESVAEAVIQHTDSPKEVSTNSFSFKTGYDRYIRDIQGSILGMYWSGVLTRGTQIWSFEVSHCLFGSLPDIA